MHHRQLWMAGDGTMYELRVEFGRTGPAALIFRHLGEGRTASVPIHPTVVLDQLSRGELEELLREARDA